MNSKLSWGVGLLLVALLVGGGLGLVLSRQGQLIQPPPVQSDTTAQPANPTLVSEKTNQTAPAQPAADLAAMPAPEDQSAGTNWEEKLDEVLVSDADEASKAASILALMPNASEEGKIELAQHLVNMVQDDNYSATGDLLTNPNTPSGVSTVLMNDLLNRNNHLKLPLLLAIARTDNHPLHNDAKDMLELFIQDDKGSNWDEWQLAVDNWLRDNP